MCGCGGSSVSNREKLGPGSWAVKGPDGRVKEISDEADARAYGNSVWYAVGQHPPKDAVTFVSKNEKAAKAAPAAPVAEQETKPADPSKAARSGAKKKLGR